ncbi:hypothetical protein [Vibrio harveyi]|nr:hypothetical protein [Vibrio harveyi]MBY7699116.1 hypothetical protein [Vibrio harveyi]PNM62787.1 hypothetical protein AL540_007125 [Vibrio harveyi]UIL56259.1 hypothetical protein LXG94_01120 [Vibrio harveyi]SQA35475.1 Uncharacterized protein conserved in bacteria [Vibrio harveyi]
MTILNVQLKNCYGISELKYDFDFSGRGNRAFAIYAPNGLMKTSFTRTFDALRQEKQPQEERFQRPSTANVNFKGDQIDPNSIYILNSNIDLTTDDESVTNLLINRESKEKYDSLVKDIESAKSKMLSKLQKLSKVKKADVEETIRKDFPAQSLIESLQKAKTISPTFSSDKVFYADVFHQKAVEVLDSPEFVLKAREFLERYDDVFKSSGGLYLKGVFNPNQADASRDALEKNAFFDAGHTIKIQGDTGDIGLEEFKEKIKEVNKEIDTDTKLKTLKTKLAKNAQSMAIQTLLESSSPTEAESLIVNLNPGKREWFKQELWRMYIENCPEVDLFLSAWESNKEQIQKLEEQAAQEAPQWLDAIELFNSRFVDMPFKLGLFNQSDAILGKSKAVLKFIFTDKEDTLECERHEISSLSQGERRALYLLSFIFDVEYRKRESLETIFIIDDVADSFDYKNKHAILQYLDDLNKTEFFYQVILTHNFDFYRSLLLSFIPDKRCLMVNKSETELQLVQSEGVRNIFVGLWKKHVTTSNSILYSCVPFTRNLIEFTTGTDDEGYLLLTKLLHWKQGSSDITVGQYFEVYNQVFSTEHNPENQDSYMIDLLFDTADSIVSQADHEGVNLQDKVLLSIAIRVKAEKFITEELRTVKGADYWSTQFSYGRLLGKEFEIQFPDSQHLPTLKKVSVTVCSNIHLNSFMYEPILDLSITHLIDLYNEISGLT